MTNTLQHLKQTAWAKTIKCEAAQLKKHYFSHPLGLSADVPQRRLPQQMWYLKEEANKNKALAYIKHYFFLSTLSVLNGSHVLKDILNVF